jgi:N-acetylmuramoyl-L-alanine amidase
MRASNILKHESGFRQSGVDSNGKTHVLEPFTVTVPGTSEQIAMVSCRMQSGDESFFYKEEFKKQQIVLHFTAGYLKGDIATLTTMGNHVSTPFVIARDGTIYNLWPSKYWSYHLGPGAQGGNTEMSRSSVAIELSNIGWLRERDGDLVTYFGNDDVYCSRDETTRYVRTKTPFREQTYFATFTDAQYESTAALLRYLTTVYAIPRRFVEEGVRFGVVDDIATFRGITSHVNYRKSDKWDIGPAFEWGRLAEFVGG